jgi:hypothetical protein
MIEAETIEAMSRIRLLTSIEAFYAMLVLMDIFLDNARYHHAKIMQEWFAQPGRRIKLRFIPAYCPHLNPIERLWGVMQAHHAQQILRDSCPIRCLLSETTMPSHRARACERRWKEEQHSCDKRVMEGS